MQNRSIKIALLILIFGLSSANAGVIDPLRIGGGARSLAMGRTAVAAPGRLDALFGNPANLAAVKSFGITSMQTKIAEDVNYILLETGFPTPYGKFAIGYLGSGVSGINQTAKDSNGRVISTGTFDYSNTVIPLAWAKPLNRNLGVGSMLKIYNKSFSGISGGNASGQGLDIGALFRLSKNIILGASLQNFILSNISWSNGTKEDLPATLNCGISFFFPKKDILVGTDFNIFTDSPAELRGGIEWIINPFLALRGGIEYLPAGGLGYIINPTLGIGLKQNNIGFDYAYYMDSTLAVNSTHYFSLSFQLPKDVKRKALPKKEKELSKEDKELIERIEKYIERLNGKLKKARTPRKKELIKRILEDEYIKKREIIIKYN